MTVFYRGPCARITHEVLEVWCPTYRWFAIRDLSHVYTVEQATDPPPPIDSIKTGSTGVAGASALVIALGWATDWRTLDSPVLVLATLALLAVSIAVSGACWRIRASDYQLSAIYRGQPVRVYQTTDARTFGQVRRALLRALEQLHDTR